MMDAGRSSKTSIPMQKLQLHNNIAAGPGQYAIKVRDRGNIFPRAGRNLDPFEEVQLFIVRRHIVYF